MIAHCTKCHHEAQRVRRPGDCDWCGAPMEKIANDYLESDIFKRAMRPVTAPAEDPPDSAGRAK